MQEKTPRTDPATNQGDKGLTSFEDSLTTTPNSEKINSKVQNQGEQSNPRGAYDVTQHIIAKTNFSHPHSRHVFKGEKF